MGHNRERLIDLFKMEDKHYKMLLEYRDERKIYILRMREGRAIFVFSLFLCVVASFTGNPYTLVVALATTALGWVHWFAYSEVIHKPGSIARSIHSLRKDIGLKRMIVEKDEVHDFLPHGLVHLRKKIEDVKKEIEKLN